MLSVHGSAWQKRGWPDMQVYHRRWTGHLELKVERDKASPLQRKRIRDLRAQGTSAFVLRLPKKNAAVLEAYEDDREPPIGLVALHGTGSNILDELALAEAPFRP